LLGNAAEARRQAEVCISYSGELEPFYVGYAREARARAAKIAGDKDLARSHKEQSKMLAGAIKEKGERDEGPRLDLDSLRPIADFGTPMHTGPFCEWWVPARI
jgi:hypothetical protein